MATYQIETDDGAIYEIEVEEPSSSGVDAPAGYSGPTLSSDPVGALTSWDWWTTRPDGTKDIPSKLLKSGVKGAVDLVAGTADALSMPASARDDVLPVLGALDERIGLLNLIGGTPKREPTYQEAASELRREYIGDPEYDTPLGRIVGKGVEYLPSAIIPIGESTLAARAVPAIISGLGGGVAKEAGYPELVGAIAAPAGVALAKSGARSASDVVKAVRDPSTEAGQQRRAGQLLLEYSGDPNLPKTIETKLAEQAAEGALPAGNPYTGLKSTAELTDSAGLASLERSLQKADIPEAGAVAERAEQRETLRRGVLDSLAPKTEGAEAVQAAIQGQADEAAARAQATFETLPAEIDQSAAGDTIRDALSRGKIAGNKATREAYEAIPGQKLQSIPTGGLERARELASTYYGPGYKDLPGDLSALVEKSQQAGMVLDDVGPVQSYEFLKNLRSYAGDLRKLYESRPDGARGAALAGEIQTLIDDTFESALTNGGFSPEQAAAYKGALVQRATVGDMYQRGAVADVLMKGPEGSYRTLSSNVAGRFYDTSPEAFRHFQRALGGDAASRDALIRDAVTDLRRQTVSESGLNVKGWQKWIADHQDLLNTFPEVRAKLATVANEHGLARSLDENFARFLDADPHTAMSTILAGKNPEQRMAQLVAQVNGDPKLTGDIQRGVIDHISDLVTSTGGDKKLLTSKLDVVLRRNEKALEKVFTKEHVGQIRAIAEDIASEASVGRRAAQLSTGQSATNQFETVAKSIKENVLEKLGLFGDTERDAAVLAAAAVPLATGSLVTSAASGVVAGAANLVMKRRIERAANAINQKLLKAAANPYYAYELASTATAPAVQAAARSPLHYQLLVAGARALAMHAPTRDSEQHSMPSRAQARSAPAASGATAGSAAQAEERTPRGAQADSPRGLPPPSPQSGFLPVSTGSQRSSQPPQVLAAQRVPLTPEVQDDPTVDQVSPELNPLMAQLYGKAGDTASAMAQIFGPAASSSGPSAAMRALYPQKSGDDDMTTLAELRAVEAEIDADPYTSALYETESGRNPKAKNPTSSASGAFQFVKKTAKDVGLKDPMDIRQSLDAVRRLTAQFHDTTGGDPYLNYSAHYLGEGLLRKVLSGAMLTTREQSHVNDLNRVALPRFRRIYDRIIAERQQVTT